MRPSHAARSAAVNTRCANRSPCSASNRRSAAVSTMSRPIPRITVSPAQHAAAVDVQYLTGDMARQARAQKDDGTRYILGTGDAQQRKRLLDRRTAAPGVRLRRDLRVDPPRRDAVDRDLGRQLDGERLGNRDDGAL